VPGVSVSQVARRYDVNANMVFKWLRDPRFKPAEDDLRSFLPVEVLPDASPGAVMADGDAGALDSRIEITLSNGQPRQHGVRETCTKKGDNPYC
jgi:transposase